MGSEVAGQLLRSGHEVVGADNVNQSYDTRLKDYRLKRLVEKEGFKFVEADISDGSAVGKLLDRGPFDAIFNLAARAGVGYSLTNPFIYLKSNTLGTLNILDQMGKREVPKLVLASTSSLYAGQKMPFLESLPVNTPISPYAASKKAAEVMAYSYHYLYDVDVSIVRFFTVYGPCGRPDMSIFRIIQWIENELPIQLLGTGEQSRDFTFISDVAQATIPAAKHVGYEIFNVGGGNQPISINWIIRYIEDRLGKKATVENLDYHPADMDATWADISKAKTILGWSPKVSIEDGLDRTVAWHVENADWLRNVNLQSDLGLG